ncbi:hypothetical protein DFP72DRAFT_74564 [Ephemerocybe angulata]|uniref:Uncharacterized protein n=1 Tax=Ephemerocybe angulata TaxID=980116 RepID=A0A8H6MC68_9AGAR|nr:hypothetical protein DFP72DRAFT_74564 [Tulosesus angulatus]
MKRAELRASTGAMNPTSSFLSTTNRANLDDLFRSPRPQTVNSPPFSSTSLRIRRLLPNAVPPTIAHAQPRRSVPQIVPTRTHRELHLVGLCSHCTVPTATHCNSADTHLRLSRCAATLPADPRQTRRVLPLPPRFPFSTTSLTLPIFHHNPRIRARIRQR